MDHPTSDSFTWTSKQWHGCNLGSLTKVWIFIAKHGTPIQKCQQIWYFVEKCTLARQNQESNDVTYGKGTYPHSHRGSNSSLP